jgi:RNA polymerase sigma factor (TIGR02999 family)
VVRSAHAKTIFPISLVQVEGCHEKIAFAPIRLTLPVAKSTFADNNGVCRGIEESVDPGSGGAVSQLLEKWRAGDSEAINALVPLVYDDLRRLARRHLQKQRPDHTLQSTALVHEAYLRLARHEKMGFENRAHFFAVLARIMRQILVDHARNHHAAKRDAGIKLVLDEAISPSPLREVSVVALDDALQGLSQLDSRQGHIVELRFFGGLSIEETALVLGVSSATVKREWTTARLWLRKQLSRGSQARV